MLIRRPSAGAGVAPDIPDDPALPALAAIRTAGLAAAIPSLGLKDAPVELLLRGYTRGSRATFEARVGQRRFAVKAYADDPTREAELYDALAAAGLAGTSGARVPPLLAWERDLRVLVIGWLEGPTANDLIKRGEGRRAGELAAQWLRGAAAAPIPLGPPFTATDFLRRAVQWTGGLRAADPVLGAAAGVVAGLLALTEPEPRVHAAHGRLATLVESARDRTRGWLASARASDPALRFAASALPPRPTLPRAKQSAPVLVHGTLYARHLLDTGDGPGVIDWQRFGQGPVELDAGTFLATVWRIGLRDESVAREAARAEEAFLAGTAGLVNGHGLAWYRAAMLLRLANKQARRKQGSLAHGHALLAEAVRQAEAAG